MTPNIPPANTEIPILPGHYRQTAWYFVRCFLGMLVGFGVFGLGLKEDVVFIQVAGGVIGFVAFLCMFGVMSRAQSAPCPSCMTKMAQAWDAERASSDGVFVCPQCQSRWRTRAVWGVE